MSFNLRTTECVRFYLTFGKFTYKLYQINNVNQEKFLLLTPLLKPEIWACNTALPLKKHLNVLILAHLLLITSEFCEIF